MKYFIGVSLPKKYKLKIEMLRAEFRFFTTEPHITLVPPPPLPDDDSFIADITKICQETECIKIRLNNLRQFGRRVLYVGVHSPELTELNKKIYEKLNLKKENRDYVPHLTVVKQRPGRPVDIDLVRKRAEKVLIPPPPEYILDSVIIYYQPKEKSIYIPYMSVPLKN
jgi:2'-5' RNA ligase